MSSKEPLWKLEGFSSKEEWLKNEQQLVDRAITNAPDFIEQARDFLDSQEGQQLLKEIKDVADNEKNNNNSETQK